MCFNGTENFEGKAIINYLESIGMKFGREINAYTIHDETVYTLMKVPVNVDGAVDTSLMVLYEWAGAVAMKEAEIDAERGVIHEEWRTRTSGSARIRNKTMEVILSDSKYAIHNVIGSLDVIDNHPYDTIRAFYNDWYRPDEQAIIAVGDFDVKELEAKIVKMFSKLEMPKNPKERKYYPVPDHKDTKIVIATDKEVTRNNVSIFYKHDPAKDRNNEAFYRSEYVEQLYGAMINGRLQEIAQQDNAPFNMAFSGYSNFVRTKDAYMSIGIAKNNMNLVTLEALLTENERVLRHGFTATELERAKKEMMSQMESLYEGRNKQKSNSIASHYQDHFLTGEPYPGMDWEYAFAKRIMPGITLEEINALAKKWITKENRVISITGPQKEGVKVPTEDEVRAIIAKVEASEVAAYVDNFANRPLVAEEPTPGKITETNTTPTKVEWTLSNGVKVVMIPTDHKDNEVIMRAYSFGGTSTVKAKDDVTAGFAAGIAKESGLGDFDKIELSKQLSGKQASVSPYISELTEGMNGYATPKDFETLMQLTYLQFTKPRFDKSAFNTYMKRQKAFLENQASDPNSAFRDTIGCMLSSHHPRKAPTTLADLEKVSLSKAKYIFEDRFGDPSGFTFLFLGNVDTAAMRPMIEKYLGGLPTVSRPESYVDLGVRMPIGEKVENQYYREMETPKATVLIAFTGEMKKASIEDALYIEAVKEYLNLRMTETLREEEGGTYGASVFTQIKKLPTNEYFLAVYFDADPAKTERMIEIVYEELAKLQKEGPDAKRIENIVENKLKEYSENVKDNNYWIRTIQSDYMYGTDKANFDYAAFWKELSAKDVQKAAKKFFTAKSSILIEQTGAKSEIK
jgi:zinc protease